MSEEVTEGKTAPKKTEYTSVNMEDGSVVEFPGSRKVSKTVVVDEEAGTVALRIDHANGRVLNLNVTGLSAAIQLRLMGHGASQKVGDNSASVKDIDDIYLAHEAMAEQLTSGDWGRAREAGDSMAGASVVIRAICEATGKDVTFVKAYLQTLLDSAKDKGEKLTRQALYASFRNPKSKTGQIIRRLEEEAASKNSAVNSDDILAGMEEVPA